VGIAAVIVLPGAVRSDATLGVDSDPSGAEVRINGELRGQTPLKLMLAPGTYRVLIGTGSAAKERQVTLAGSELASIYSEVAPSTSETAPAAPLVSALSVATEPAGGRVTVDGVDRGVAPLVVQSLVPGEHRITVRNQGAVFQRTVTIEAGATATVVVGGTAAAAAGWLSVDSPLRLQISEGGRVIGTTEADRLMLPTGQHQLTFADDTTGFRVVRALEIAAGQTTTVALQVPRAPVNVNAIPWADVWINNERIGETPIGNYMLPLGEHELELRNPQLGTKRVRLSVSMNGPNRVAVNMRDR
jgi:hypothetical protein